MAILIFNYCSPDLGFKQVSVQYDDVSRTVISGSLSTKSCFDGYKFNNSTLYYHDVGGLRYYVRVKTSSPYAHVVSGPIPTCNISIDNIIVTNASSLGTADGVLEVVASANGAVQFSKDNGVTYQTSRFFTGLLPGTYNIKVKTTFEGVTCYDTAKDTVGVGVVTCDPPLMLGTIEVTGTTIEVLNLLNVQGAVEYRIDNEAWKISPQWSGLTNGNSYLVQVRYKELTSCSDGRNVTATNATCVNIVNIFTQHESSVGASNGYIRVTAESGVEPYTYELYDKDDVLLFSQSSPEFGLLSPQRYTVKVIDDNDCFDQQIVEIFRSRTPFADLSLAQAHRFVLQGVPANFDNTLFKNLKIPGVSNCEYFMPVQSDDIHKVQVRTNYSVVRAAIYNYDTGGFVGSVSGEKKTDLTGISESIAAYVSNYSLDASKKQVFFNSGLPTWAEIGQSISLTDFASGALNTDFEIVDIVPGTGDADGFESALITLGGSYSTQLGTVSTIYDIEDYDVYEVQLDWFDFIAARYYMQLTLEDDQFLRVILPSEPVDLKATHDDTVVITWRNFDNGFKIDYTTGIEHLMRLKGVLKLATPGGERSTMEDSKNSLIKLDEDVTRQVELRVYDIPPYMAEKLKVIFAHDYVTVNGVRYTADEDLEMETFANDALVNASIILRQYDFDAINSDDSGGIDSPVNILGLNNDLFEVNPA